MSMYVKARLFVAWVALLLATFSVWAPFVQTHFGSSGVVIGGLLWLGHGAIGMLFFTCPDCDFPLFMTKRPIFNAYHPWPNRTCSKCRRDHSMD